ncbi:MAG: hypothetical protein ABI199_04780 [Bacteroidia bacterium]
MPTTNKLGIWMDHSEAHLIELNNESSPTAIINNTFNHDDMEFALSKGEFLMHNKRQQHQAAYYKKLGDVIILYNEVILFGPTDAKTELLNVLRTDHRFEKIKIEVQATDKMSENKKQAFVRAHFSKQ